MPAPMYCDPLLAYDNLFGVAREGKARDEFEAETALFEFVRPDAEHLRDKLRPQEAAQVHALSRRAGDNWRAAAAAARDGRHPEKEPRQKLQNTLPSRVLNWIGGKRVSTFKTGKRTLGYKDQGMGLVLKYLEHAAKDTGHAELTTVPIVGWLGQAGGHFCKDLYQRAPQRVLAWADSFGGELRKYPELTREIPFRLCVGSG